MGSSEKPLLIGWASTSITPDQPVQLMGQMHERISEYVHDPVTATALALECQDANGASEQAIMVSCDLVHIPSEVMDRLREAVAPRLDGFDLRKLVVSATHTHTAPVMLEGGWYPVPGAGIMRPSEYVKFLLARLSDMIAEAWDNRKPGGISWALGHAAVGFNRRVVYDDGTARMYGTSDTERFRGVEGSQDHGVEMLFTWDLQGELTGMAINVACPSQVVEGQCYVSADFWDAARNELRERYSEDLYVLPLTGAAGDQSPRDLVRRGRGEPNMRDDSGRCEMGRRIANAVDYVLDLTKKDVATEVVFEHAVEELVLPARIVTREEAESARRAYDALMKEGPFEVGTHDATWLLRHKGVMERFEEQGENPTFAMELHVIRLGDIALATNPFELYLDYGLRMKARSKAQQTFVVQLACGSGVYLPTAKAVAGGHYGAMVEDGHVGPEGGQVLVDRTVELINSMWDGDAQ